MFVKDLNVTQIHNNTAVLLTNPDIYQLEVSWQQDHYIITHVYPSIEATFFLGGNYSCRAQFQYQNAEVSITSKITFVDVQSKFDRPLRKISQPRFLANPLDSRVVSVK